MNIEVFLQQLIKKKDIILEYDKKIIDGINDAKILKKEHFRYKNFLNYNNYIRIANLTTQLVNHHPHNNAGDNTPGTSQAPESPQQVTQTQAKHLQQVLDIPVEITSSPNTKHHLLNKLLQIKYWQQFLRAFLAQHKIQVGFRNLACQPLTATPCTSCLYCKGKHRSIACKAIADPNK